VLPVSLRAIAPREGDIPAGGGRDTSLEFRGTIATAVTCDSVAGGAVMAPSAALPRLLSLLTRPEPRDTAWVLSIDGPKENWQPRPIAFVADTTVACAVGTTLPFGPALRPAMVLRWTGAGVPSGTVIRITRPWRYSLYKGGDGGWYLGAKEWTPSTSRYSTVQPVAGPLMSAAHSGLRFRYADSSGATVSAGAAITTTISLIEISVLGDSLLPSHGRSGLGARPRTSAAVALRNP
jgi:hypothetical protein